MATGVKKKSQTPQGCTSVLVTGRALDSSGLERCHLWQLVMWRPYCLLQQEVKAKFSYISLKKSLPCSPD